MSNFRPLVFVGRGSETQIQVGAKSTKLKGEATVNVFQNISDDAIPVERVNG